MRLLIETKREGDGRWPAEIPPLPGAVVYGQTRQAAIAAVKVLAPRIIADEIKHDERSPEAAGTTFDLAA